MRSNTGHPNSAIVFRTLWPSLTVVTCLGELRVHDEAVRPTLDWIEDTMLVARGWNPGPWQGGGDFPPHRSRNPDPQFHTCAVIANMTRDDEGRWRNTEPALLHRNARLIGTYWRNELSRRHLEKGWDHGTGHCTCDVQGEGRASTSGAAHRQRRLQNRPTFGALRDARPCATAAKERLPIPRILRNNEALGEVRDARPGSSGQRSGRISPAGCTGLLVEFLDVVTEGMPAAPRVFPKSRAGSP